MQQLNLIYFSPTGNTEKIVEAVAEGMGPVSNRYNLTLPLGRRQVPAFGPEDTVIVGVPVYGGRVPALLDSYLDLLRGTGTSVVLVVVYGNRHYEDALIELKTRFESQGFISIAGAAFIGEHSYTSLVATGRPDQDDLNQARSFGVIAADLLPEAANLVLKVPGNVPYRDRGKTPETAPVTNDACTRCGLCASHCPTEAIDFQNYFKSDAAKCIRCCSCIRLCPVQAKSIQHEAILQIIQRLNENFSQIRKDVELFYGIPV
jgi:ferredoxin